MPVLLYYLSGPSTAQNISPTDLQGQVGEVITFTCTSLDVNDTGNTLLEFQAPNGGFTVIDDMNNDRLNRSDFGSTTTYTYGPLTPEDNNMVFRCQSSGVASPVPATINVVCKCTTMSVYMYKTNTVCVCMVYKERA